MNWRKEGLVFTPPDGWWWGRSHAALPTTLHLSDDIYRVYFATRDDRNRSHVGFVEFDIMSPREQVGVSLEPVLAPGPLGSFDDHGVLPSSLVRHGPDIFLYYIGWNPGIRPPLFYTSIGLAVSEDGGRTFQKVSAAPVMARSDFDPCFVSGPWVILDNGIWRMWYISCFQWKEVAGQLQSYYHIKYADSRDGITWERNGLVCIDLRPEERNIGRPCVIKNQNGYTMWYSYDAGRGYRIGYAESLDGYVWTRLDEIVGIDVSSSGWDSAALAQPLVLNHGTNTYMLYHGNNFGREGFGLAVLIPMADEQDHRQSLNQVSTTLSS